MKIEDLTDLSKLVDLLREKGVAQLQVDGVVILMGPPPPPPLNEWQEKLHQMEKSEGDDLPEFMKLPKLKEGLPAEGEYERHYLK